MDTIKTDPTATYIMARWAETTDKSRASGRFRNAMISPLVVLLREEAGMSWEAISEELSVSYSTARRAYDFALGRDLAEQCDE